MKDRDIEHEKRDRKHEKREIENEKWELVSGKKIKFFLHKHLFFIGGKSNNFIGHVPFWRNSLQRLRVSNQLIKLELQNKENLLENSRKKKQWTMKSFNKLSTGIEIKEELWDKNNFMWRIDQQLIFADSVEHFLKMQFFSFCFKRELFLFPEEFL